jgi:hypothetical protein
VEGTSQAVLGSSDQRKVVGSLSLFLKREKIPDLIYIWKGVIFDLLPRPTSLGHRSQITEGPVLRDNEFLTQWTWALQKFRTPSAPALGSLISSKAQVLGLYHTNNYIAREKAPERKAPQDSIDHCKQLRQQLLHFWTLLWSETCICNGFTLLPIALHTTAAALILSPGVQKLCSIMYIIMSYAFLHRQQAKNFEINKSLLIRHTLRWPQKEQSCQTCAFFDTTEPGESSPLSKTKCINDMDTYLAWESNFLHLGPKKLIEGWLAKCLRILSASQDRSTDANEAASWNAIANAICHLGLRLTIKLFCFLHPCLLPCPEEAAEP